MRPEIGIPAFLTLVLAGSLGAAPPAEPPMHPAPSGVLASVAKPSAPASVDPGSPTTTLPAFHFEPIGLSLIRPYERGKIPVVFIHGLWLSPWSWARMCETLESDQALLSRYQVWTFGYSTGEPLLYSALLLRHSLREARKRFDPDGTDAAFDRMVLVGHSMGGLLAKIVVQDSGSKLWDLLCSRPFDAMAGTREDRDILQEILFFKPLPEVRRVVFIATPHRGSKLDQGALHHIGLRLVRTHDPLQAAHDRLLKANGPGFFTPLLREKIPTSIDQLAWGHPELLALTALAIKPGVSYHSIIADRRNPPRPGGSDGVVPYASSHLDGPRPEFLVSAGHLCQDIPPVIEEVRRILVEHLKP